jgi:hypothetical protein
MKKAHHGDTEDTEEFTETNPLFLFSPCSLRGLRVSVVKGEGWGSYRAPSARSRLKAALINAR